MRLIDKAYKIAFDQLKVKWKEIPGSDSNPLIKEAYLCVDGLNNIELNDDIVPWCSAFVNWCVQKAGGRGTRSPIARSWMSWGFKSDGKLGDIVVLKRGVYDWQAHVGFVYKKDLLFVHVLGGNQYNSVNVTRYLRSRVLGYRTSKD